MNPTITFLTLTLLTAPVPGRELDELPQPYQFHFEELPEVTRPAPQYSTPAPVPVVPIERGSYYQSNQYGSTYSNPTTGVFCQSNRYGSSCY